MNLDITFGDQRERWYSDERTVLVIMISSSIILIILVRIFFAVVLLVLLTRCNFGSSRLRLRLGLI